MKYFRLLVIGLFFTLYNCSSDDQSTDLITVGVDFEVSGCDEVASGAVVGTITSNLTTPITFSLELGSDSNMFTIDPVTGEITIATSLDVTIVDLEGVYDFTVVTLNADGTVNGTYMVTVTVSTSTINDDVSSGLLGYYPFSGNANDESGNNNHGVVYGAALTTDGANTNDSAYHFSNNNYISIENVQAFDNLNEFTLSAWVHPDFLDVHNNIISKVTPNRDFNLQLTNVGIDAHFAEGSTYYRAWFNDYALSLNTWTHVVSTWDGTNWKIYINGDLVKVSADYNVEPLWNGGYMTIGNLLPNSHEGFNGKIDDVRIYNRVITSCEIDYLSEEYTIN
ncbi:LamG-like jellyroll fold domain-containing protein [uncultured Kordia sp.]|uniref:LamG-like jellyroll fold domain-containing protein n=1 Tax=uncultured Kordia sp. TaxID=507699 RepID=UPI00260CC3C7|nr:LamG-like jellyroll fold domain-containing protein [uncultured Kordia sp.]